jgi:hypothetical protein
MIYLQPTIKEPMESLLLPKIAPMDFTLIQEVCTIVVTFPVTFRTIWCTAVWIGNGEESRGKSWTFVFTKLLRTKLPGISPAQRRRFDPLN